jgi:hypothetical protein
MNHVMKDFLNRAERLSLHTTPDGFRLMESVPTPGNKYGLMCISPCVNYRTKHLVALISSGVEMRLVSVTLAEELPKLDTEAVGAIKALLNRKLATYGWNIKAIAANGMHMVTEGTTTHFEIGSTRVISFTEGLLSADAARESTVFEVPYRKTSFVVRSTFFTSTMSLDSIFCFIHSLIPNIYNVGG